jgi:exosortase/archaeosortase
MVIHFGIRNIVCGICHYLFEQQYYKKLTFILSVELVFIAYTVYLMHKGSRSESKRHTIFESKGRIFIGVILTGFLRVLLILTFWVTYGRIPD